MTTAPSRSSRPAASAALASGGVGMEAFWRGSEETLLRALDTSPAGLSAAEAARRLAASGPNLPHDTERGDDIHLLLRQFASPIVLLLITATLISFMLGDVTDALIILVIVVASGLLGFWQERAASHAVAALLQRVTVAAEVRRGGQIVTLPVDQIVPGDIVLLNAGDIIPGDGRVLETDNLLVDEAALTGESYPVEKAPGALPVETPENQRTNAVFMGSHVVSGSSTVVIARTGAATEYGQVAGSLSTRPAPTGFEQGITNYGYLLVRATLVLVSAVFGINLLLHRPPVESLFFSLALSVGLTPQLLPAIVTVSLATGARQMARKQVIVKRLDAIEDFGAMTVLCTDKTGTLTTGVVTLTAALDVTGAPCDRVARLAWLNAQYQTGYTNPLDQAILQYRSFDVGNIERVEEVPYDFTRKRLSVLVRDGGEQLLICKGALASVLAVCDRIESPTGAIPLDSRRKDVEAEFALLSSEGFRVLGIATRPLNKATCDTEDEQDMTFAGFLAFADPPKPGTAAAVAELADLGITIRMITGDNRLAAAHIGAAVGLDPTSVLTGSELANLSDQELAPAARGTAIFAEIEPEQKERLVRALRSSDNVVSYLGDGINDASALHAADVGISVDTAVDVAKQAAAIVLLDKNLAVVADGVRLGRQTFVNTMKYIYVTTSANFGNVLSMAAAAAFLPFLPLLPKQILLLNFLSDIPAMTIAADRVDPEQVARPQVWNVTAIRKFMLIFGSISSVFDVATFAALRGGFDAGPELFRSGWFVVSVLTELAVMLVLRTRRRFYQSRPGQALLLSSAGVAVATLALPFSPLAPALDLTGLPAPVLLAMLAIVTGYILATEAAKWLLFRQDHAVSPPGRSDLMRS